MKQQTLYNLHHFFLRPVAEALAYAHKKGIIHCDFKPSNVFIMDDEQVKVIDFGIAQAVKRKDAAETDVTVFDAGLPQALSPPYASPEIIDGEDPDPRRPCHFPARPSGNYRQAPPLSPGIRCNRVASTPVLVFHSFLLARHLRPEGAPRLAMEVGRTLPPSRAHHIEASFPYSVLGSLPLFASLRTISVLVKLFVGLAV